MLTSVVFSILDMTKTFDGANHETVILKLQDVGASNPVIQCFFVAIIMMDKWFNPLNIVRAHYPLTAAFSREVYSDHFYLAYTLMIFLQHYGNAASRAI